MNMNVYDKYRCIIKSAEQQASQSPAAVDHRTAKAGVGMGPSVNAYYNPDGGEKPVYKCLAALTRIKNRIQLHNSPAPRELVTGELPPSPDNMQTEWVAEADRKRNLEKRAVSLIGGAWDYCKDRVGTALGSVASRYVVDPAKKEIADFIEKEIHAYANDPAKLKKALGPEAFKHFKTLFGGNGSGADALGRIADIYNNRYKYMAGLGAAAVGLPVLGSYMGASMAAGGQSQPQQQYNEQQSGGYSGVYNDERTEDAMVQQMMQGRNSRAAQQQRQ